MPGGFVNTQMPQMYAQPPVAQPAQLAAFAQQQNAPMPRAETNGADILIRFDDI
jgi:hypothetical protein